MMRAGCTIVSLNYLPYARTLSRSFLAQHPDCQFVVLLVDRLPADFDATKEPFEIVSVEELGIPDFCSVAFKYGVLELNTNVKPSFLKYLLSRQYDQVVYLDPDIFVYRELEPVFAALTDHPIALTPHMLTPNDEIRHEISLLSAGVFNLGFIALKRCEQTFLFLDWWENRCLEFGFDERRSGAFVDQKWINFVPCFFENVFILRHPGCNMAYWNFHERRVVSSSANWKVNGTEPLYFFHFSGISVDGGEKISRYSTASLSERGDLRPIVQHYREELVRNGIREAGRSRYAFGSFDNGQPVNQLCRSMYAAHLAQFRGEDPFRSSSSFYAWASAKGMLSSGSSATSVAAVYSKNDLRIRAVHFLMRLALRVLGAERYVVLMKYLSYVSVLQNQEDVFETN